MRRTILVGLLSLSAACGTETLELRTVEVTAAKGLAPDAAKARLFVPQFDDRAWTSDLGPEWEKIRLNGEYVVMKRDPGPGGGDDSYFVGPWGAFDVDPGTYLFEVERPNGQIVGAQTIVLAPGSHNEVVLYGATGTESSRPLLDSLAGVAPGQVRARFMNVLSSHLPIDIVSCAQWAWGCPPGHDCSNDGGVCGLIDVGSDCTVLAQGIGYGEVWEQVVPAGTDVRARVPLRVGEGFVERSLLSRPEAGAASFESVYLEHVWGPGDWFDVCTNYVQFQFVEPGTYTQRTPG
jgi:hypothetical protein